MTKSEILTPFFCVFALLMSLQTASSQQFEFGSVVAPQQTGPTAMGRDEFEKRLDTVEAGWHIPHRVMLYVSSNYAPPAGTVQYDPANPPDVNTIDGLMQERGMTAQWIGHILTIAPATMTSLNNDPGLSELPLADLESIHPLPSLLGSLTQQQFNLLASSGLGMSDLTPDQQEILQSLIPNPLSVVSTGAVHPSYTNKQLATPGFFQQVQKDGEEYQKEVITVPNDEVYRDIRIHAYLNEEYIVGGDFGIKLDSSLSASSGDRKLSYDSLQSQQPSQTALSKQLIADITNLPKASDISWRRRDLQDSVNYENVKTVGDLVKRIAKATHLELYADVNYANYPLTIVGDSKANLSAAELMQSLALSVSGAWRQVGNVYILTNDVVGLGERQQFLSDVVTTWGNRLQEADGNVYGHLQQLNWIHALLNEIGDTLDLSNVQVASICSNDTNGKIAWGALSAPLQNAINDQLTTMQTHFEDEDNNDLVNRLKADKQQLNPTAPVQVEPSIELSLELPNTGVMRFQNFRPWNNNVHKEPTTDQKIKLTQNTRGILCAPKTADEVVRTVDMMSDMGFNALYLDVFANGRTYFKSNAIPPETDDNASVLASAIAEAKLKNIPVYAVVDLLCWRKDGDAQRPELWPTQFDEDVNVFGEPSDVGVRRRQRQDALNSQLKDEPINESAESWVSPMDPAVRKVLPELVKEISATPGIAGLIFQDTAAPGYGTRDALRTTLDLGYGLANRLNFIRLNQEDPIDLSSASSTAMWLPFEGWQLQFDYQVPGFSSADETQWASSRSDADLSLLKDCYNAAFTTKPTLPLYMRERSQGITFDPWTKAASVNQLAQIGSFAMNDKTILLIPAASYLLNLPETFTWIVRSYGRRFVNNPDSIALDLETGAVDVNVPTMLNQIKSDMASQ